MSFIGTVKISGPVSPTSPADVYPSHMALYGLGGFRSVQDITERDNIPDPRREIGMKVYVIDEDKEYRLKDGITNNDWIEVTFGSGSGCCNYITVPLLTDMVAIPPEERFKGLSVYVQDTDQEFRLMGGIEDSNWVLVSEPVLIGTTNEVINQDGTTTIENVYNTFNNYVNSFACLNDALVKDAIINAVQPNYAIYVDDSGNKIISAEEVNEFKAKLVKDIIWLGDSVLFSGKSYSTNNGELNELFLEINAEGLITTFNLYDVLTVGTLNPVLSFYGNKEEWVGYLKFSNVGKKDIRIWQEINGIKQFEFTDSILVFAQNFVILDNGSTTPNDIIETTSGTLSTKSYEIFVPTGSEYKISLAKVNVTEKGIDAINYMTILNTASLFTTDGTYTIDFANIAKPFVDGTYALVLTGKENGITLPTYFYGPFNIDLL